ncbi:MAG: hypothetical protein CMP91_03915 [Gammaproteobacteria bacterium]|nr:hypothetical protein [Gammaproteobacteria bacterium]MAY01786.1 hypothetical protein [Gammaproteobacteria bacterium]|tara:strand:- start:86285 stop:86656 length:372 start_codon:yes stop_codon:yes gene_type:complete
MGQEEKIKQILDLYTEGTYEGDADKLQASFHEKAVMNGYLGEHLLLATPEPFIAEVCKQPMKDSGFAYNPVISALNIDEKVATATLEETYPDGMRFTNFFHLIDDGSGWKIISKAFIGHATDT